MHTRSIRCEACGHEIESEAVRTKYGGACPHCLGAFALEGLLAPKTPTPVPAGGEFGKFVLTDRLGKGGMGEVWKAFDKELNRWVALKFLRGESPEELARFQREARTAAGLNHPSIAAIYEVGETNGRHFIAMQYIEGRTLQMHPRNDRKSLARLVRDAAKALDHAHRLGVIHRDLKPENLMVESVNGESRIVILDFGLAKRIQGGESLSRSGTVAGTLAYMSPEQARGDKLDERADVYSLGATLYEVLTGKPPFEGANTYDIMKRIEDTEPTTPRRLNQHIPHDLETITLKCLEKDRERRYGSARDFAEDLDRFLNGDAILARRASTWYRIKMRLSKRKAILATAAAAAVVVLGLMGWWIAVERPKSEYNRLLSIASTLWGPAKGMAMAGVNKEAARVKAEAARKAFERANEVMEHAEAHVMRARCFQIESRDDEAMEALERALVVDGSHADARVEMARTLLVKYRISRGIPHSSRSADDLTQRYLHELPPEKEDERALRARADALLLGVAPSKESADLLAGLLSMGKGLHGDAVTSLDRYCAAEPWDTQALLLAAMSHFYVGNYGHALKHLDQASRLPTSVLHTWKGILNSHLGNHVQALEDLSKAIQLDRKNAQAHLSLGNEFAYVGRMDEAIQSYSTALSLRSNYGAAYSNRARAKAKSGNLAEAISDYDLSIHVEPGRANPYIGRAVVRKDLGLHKEAIADCQDAIRLEPENFVAYNVWGTVLSKLGLFSEAIDQFSAALERNPRFVDGYLNRATSLARGENLAKASEDVRKALDINPKSARAFAISAAIHSQARRYNEAISEATRAIESDAHYAEAHLQRGIANFGLGKNLDALKDFTQVVALDSTLAGAYKYLHAVYLRLGRTEEALQAIERALALNPSYAEALIARAMSAGKASDGIRDFEAVIEIHRNHPEPGDNLWYAYAYMNRGMVRAKRDEFQEAFKDYQQAIDLAPKFAEAPFNRGNLNFRLKNYEESIADFTKALEVASPDWPHRRRAEAMVEMGKGQKMMSLGRYREAVPSYEAVYGLLPKTPIGMMAAYNLACAKAKLGEAAGSLDWLEKAVESGWKDHRKIESDPDFESLRADDRFKAILSRLKGS